MKKPAPYQIFFPIGILSSVVAVAVWLFQGSGWFSTPVLLVHSRLVFGGFLWSFITGFLLTAVPRFTGRKNASWTEMSLALALIAAQIWSSWTAGGNREFYGGGVALGVFLLFFALKRLIRSARPVPVFASHILLGLSLAIAGAYFHFIGKAFLGLHLYEVGGVLLLVLGLGTRFFSFLSGLPSSFELQKKSFRHWAFHGAGILTCALLYRAGEGFRPAYFGLAAVTAVYALCFWEATRESRRRSPLKPAVRVAALAMPTSFLLTGIFPAFYVAWFHILFIGCFGLMAYSVATRVTLAHGSYPIETETKEPSLGLFFGLLCLALALRILYGLTPGTVARELFLHLAVITWILGVTSWSSSFLARIWKPGREAKAAR